MDYLIHICFLVALYSILGLSLELLAGEAGLVPLSQAAFYAIGAYTSALCSIHLGLSFLPGVLTGMATAVLMSFVVSLPTLRLHDDSFLMVTFGFQMILLSVLNNWTALTRGPMGISGIRKPIMFGWTVDSHWAFLALASVLACFAHFVVDRIATSPFGRVLHAIREDESLAKSLGKNTLIFKVAAFAVSAALAATAGSLYAHYTSYVDPTSFTAMESILVISMVIIGGAGSRWGPLVGAAVLVVVPELLRFVGLPSSVAANLRQMIYGSMLIVMMMFRPKGLVGSYGFVKVR